MPTFFKKDRKIPLKVVCQLSLLTANKGGENLMNKDIRVEFVRGSNERFISDASRFKYAEAGH